MAPGVRVRVSSRGVRTSIGPRAARVHVGSGRTGFSTGIGPVGYYTSVGGSRRSSSSSRASTHRTSTGVSSRALAQAQRAREAAEAGRVLLGLFKLHEAEFEAAQPPVAPPPPPVDPKPIVDRHLKETLSGVGWFARKSRAQARARADAAAAAEIEQITLNDARLHAEYQAHLDESWQRLVAGDPDVVLARLAEAFEDNEAAAAPLGVHGDEASLVVVVPTTDAIPAVKPATTQAGNPTTKKLTKQDAADFYKIIVAGYTLVTVKEAFAVAPSINHARIVAVRSAGADVYGRKRVEAILAARFTRASLEGVRWTSIDAVQAFNELATEREINHTGRYRELSPLDLASQPAIAAAVRAIEVEERIDA